MSRFDCYWVIIRYSRGPFGVCDWCAAKQAVIRLHIFGCLVCLVNALVVVGTWRDVVMFRGLGTAIPCVGCVGVWSLAWAWVGEHQQPVPYISKLPCLLIGVW